MWFSKRSPERTIALNMMAELLGSAIYSLLFFIFIGRHISPAYEVTFIVLSYAIGLSYFAGVYIPFHTYRIAILPFISITNALRKGQWRVIWHKLPAQFMGALIGTWLFHSLNTFTYMGDVAALPSISFSDPWLVALINGSLAAVLCYTFYVVRILFKQRRSTGTIIIALVISTLFLLSGKVMGISALNPFGLFSYQLISGAPLFQGPWYQLLVIHILFPVGLSMVAFYFVREMYGKKGKTKRKVSVSVKKTDI